MVPLNVRQDYFPGLDELVEKKVYLGRSGEKVIHQKTLFLGFLDLFYKSVNFLYTSFYIISFLQISHENRLPMNSFCQLSDSFCLA